MPDAILWIYINRHVLERVKRLIAEVLLSDADTKTKVFSVMETGAKEVHETCINRGQVR